MMASKGQTIKFLYDFLKDKRREFKVLPPLLINANELSDEWALVNKVKNIFGDKKLIIRSSSMDEDTTTDSKAGAYLSLFNVESNNLINSIKEVINSYDKQQQKDAHVLIQEMLRADYYGVIFSVDKDTLAPYFIIEYDDTKDGTTSGRGNEITSITVFRDAPLTSMDHLKEHYLIKKLMIAMKELEEIFNSKYLDVEFAIKQQDNNINDDKINDDIEIYILQVRPIVTHNKQPINVPKSALDLLYKRLKNLNLKSPSILGDRAIFGVMPDWNPAEIIGLKPKRLALSLYKELVTDNIWAYQRDNYGYRNLRSYPLMHSFLGLPFIDVRCSFNSFIPKKLDEKIANKLVNYYLDTLRNNPALHDKVEFEIVLSCYDLNILSKLDKLRAHDFNNNELKRIEFSLLDLTNNVLDSKNGFYLKDLAKTNQLKKRFTKIMNSPMPKIDKIYWLIEDCKRFGTLPFAGLARGAFISVALLNSLVDINFLTKDEKERFLLSLETVSKKLVQDLNKLKSKEISKQDFLNTYGHLRAGSYDINIPSYHESFEQYFNLDNITLTPPPPPFNLSDDRLDALDAIIKEHGLQIDARGLFEFIKITIEARESSKFEFSKFLSKVLDLIKELGQDLGINDISYLDIKDILGLYSSLFSSNLKDYLSRQIRHYKEEFNLSMGIKLGALISDPNEVYAFKGIASWPNFITTKSISAKLALGDNLGTSKKAEDEHNEEELEGKIVLIHSADPGYDYLFSKNIAGLITCYGGANSHMAIRCSELGLPAVIGLGIEKFNKLLDAYKYSQVVHLDASNKIIIY